MVYATTLPLICPFHFIVSVYCRYESHLCYLCFQYHKATIANVRKASERVADKNIAIALDTKGPEIRTGLLKGVSESSLESLALSSM